MLIRCLASVRGVTKACNCLSTNAFCTCDILWVDARDYEVALLSYVQGNTKPKPGVSSRTGTPIGQLSSAN
jgi:hypothetical protein